MVHNICIYINNMCMYLNVVSLTTKGKDFSQTTARGFRKRKDTHKHEHNFFLKT